MKKLLFLLLLPIFTHATTYYVATTGADSNPGTILQPFKNWERLSGLMVAGDIAYIRGGTYSTARPTANNYCLFLNMTGSAGSPILIQNYPGEVPVLDLTSVGVPTLCDVFGVYVITCTYLHLKGLTVRNLKQVASGCGISRAFTISGCINCTIDQVEVYNIGGKGFSIEDNSQDNTFLNCDAHHVGDGLSDGGADAWDNSDGFSCSGGDASTRTTFTGCRAYLCSDDGWDLFSTNGINTFNNCWSFWNGYKPWGTSNSQVTPGSMTASDTSVFRSNSGYWSGGGNAGEGFKLGPANTQNFATIIHFMNNCVSFQNRGTGYASNSDAALTRLHQLWNCIAYNNCNDGFSFGAGWCAGSPQRFKNNWAWLNNAQAAGADWVYDGTNTVAISNNYWDTHFGAVNYGNLKPSTISSISNADFVSVSTTGVAVARQADGSLPALNFLHLVSGSVLRNNGVNVGLPYCDGSPDLGAYEYCGATPALPTSYAGPDQVITLPKSDVTLAGVATGTSTTLLWTRVSGPNTPTISSATVAGPTVSGLIQGTYYYEFKVTDGSANIARDTMIITVNAAGGTIVPTGVYIRSVALNSAKQGVVTWTAEVTANSKSFTVYKRGCNNYAAVGTVAAVQGQKNYTGTYALGNGYSTFYVLPVDKQGVAVASAIAEVKKN